MKMGNPREKINYKLLLEKYMEIVISNESVSFIDDLSRYKGEDITENELQELQEIENKIYNSERWK